MKNSEQLDLFKSKEQSPDSKKKNLKWTMEKLHESTSKYEYVKDWRTQEPSAYVIAPQRGFLPRLTQQMVKLIDHKR